VIRSAQPQSRQEPWTSHQLRSQQLLLKVTWLRHCPLADALPLRQGRAPSQQSFGQHFHVSPARHQDLHRPWQGGIVRDQPSQCT